MCYIIASGFILDMWGFIDAGIVFMEKVVHKKTSYWTLWRKSKRYSYELKAGGNLDTKNAPSNAAEVTSLETIFSFCDKSISRFATCYDGKGDGTPDGAIGKHLDRNQILIGKEFWEEILEDGVSYNDFILAYQEAYKKAKVEETVIG